MADAVLSVRIDEELKQKFIELAKENEVNNKDLMHMMVAHFELEQAKDEKVQFNQDINELQHLTKRMAEIYLNMIERVQVQELEQKNKANVILEKIQEENEELKRQLKSANEREKEHQVLKDKMKTVKQKIEKLQEECQVFKDLNELLRQKNDKLEKNEAEMMSRLRSVEQLNDERNNLKASLDAKLIELQRVNFKVDTLEQEKTQLQQQNAKEQAEIMQKMTEQINLLKRQQQLELQELKMTLQVEHLDKIEKLKIKHEKFISDEVSRATQNQTSERTEKK